MRTVILSTNRTFLVRHFAFVIVIFCVGCGGGGGTTPQRACLNSDRSPGPQVCACAQVVADQTLSRSDQRQAAEIIADPDAFQEVNASRSNRAQSFVARYRLWGERVEQVCQP